MNPELFARGAAHTLELEAASPGGTVVLPVLFARGAGEGKRLVVTAGVHGDEYEGVRAILDLFAGLDPTVMKGDVLAVPVANPPAFHACRRTSPLDGLNLARVFPGKAAGSPTEAIAYALDQHIIRHADLYIDLHSGGVQFEMPALAGYWAGDDCAREAAMAFASPVIWEHPAIAPGRTISAACARGIPALYTEARGGGRIHADDLAFLRRGLGNLLLHLGILEGHPEPADSIVRLYGDGNIDDSTAAGCDGFLMPAVRLLDSVEQGQELGILVDLYGLLLERYSAPRSGRIILTHACPRVLKGEPVFLVTGEMSA